MTHGSQEACSSSPFLSRKAALLGAFTGIWEGARLQPPQERHKHRPQGRTQAGWPSRKFMAKVASHLPWTCPLPPGQRYCRELLSEAPSVAQGSALCKTDTREKGLSFLSCVCNLNLKMTQKPDSLGACSARPPVLWTGHRVLCVVIQRGAILSPLNQSSTCKCFC